MFNQEIWKTINGFPRYQVSNYGRIKSLIGKEKLLRPTKSKKGYLSIKLSKKTGIKGQYQSKTLKVHRLVAEHFCQGYTPNIEVHHIDLDRANNRSNNLICLTRKEHIALHKALKKQNAAI